MRRAQRLGVHLLSNAAATRLGQCQSILSCESLQLEVLKSWCHENLMTIMFAAGRPALQAGSQTRQIYR